ncbi:hypothetical protein HYFRA_00000460 [Hymenoscyphus fraxineus]|uniref:Uncharacterized protein n=1 Tax=Hymenoscyphus fraxineus TaxID=746836 RepID=A0A9N9PLA2_9HELO|nr:hypothetical protein HYFRA_00000460 [Hymenoscyphus fraxineus]
MTEGCSRPAAIIATSSPSKTGFESACLQSPNNMDLQQRTFLTAKQIYAYRITRGLLCSEYSNPPLADTYLPAIMNAIKTDPVLLRHLDMDYEDAYNIFAPARAWHIFEPNIERQYVADEYRKEKGLPLALGSYDFAMDDYEAALFCWKVKDLVKKAIGNRVWEKGKTFVQLPQGQEADGRKSDLDDMSFAGPPHTQEALTGSDNVNHMALEDISGDEVALESEEVDHEMSFFHTNDNQYGIAGFSGNTNAATEVVAGSNLNNSFSQPHQAFPENDNQLNSTLAPNTQQANKTQRKRKPRKKLQPKQQTEHLAVSSGNLNLTAEPATPPQFPFQVPSPQPLPIKRNEYPFSAAKHLMFQTGYEGVTQHYKDKAPHDDEVRQFFEERESR